MKGRQAARHAHSGQRDTKQEAADQAAILHGTYPQPKAKSQEKGNHHAVVDFCGIDDPKGVDCTKQPCANSYEHAAKSPAGQQRVEQGRQCTQDRH